MTTLPASTIIFLTRNPANELLIKPDTMFVGDTLVVAYDVKVDCMVVIPKGTRVSVTWTTKTVNEELGLYTVSVQTDSIFINGREYEMDASSGDALFNSTIRLSGIDVGFKSYFYKNRNINQRFITVNNLVRPVAVGGESVYIRVPTNEIAVRLNSDLYIDTTSII